MIRICKLGKDSFVIHRKALEISIVSALVFLGAFSNTYINSYIDLSKIQKVVGLLFMLVFLLLSISRGTYKIRRSETTIALCVVFYAWLLILSYFNGGFSRVYNAIFGYMSSFLIVIFVQYYSKNDKKILIILNTWKYILLVLVLLDLISELKYPEGLYSTTYGSDNWFLGYKTARILYSLPMCAMFFYTSMRQKGKIGLKCWAVLLLSTWDAFLSGATSASVAIIACGIFVVLHQNKLLNRFFERLMNIKIWFVVYFILVFLLTVSQSAGLLNFLSSILGKDSTFTGRIVIWYNCIKSIIDSKGLGLGYLNSNQYMAITQWSRGANAHNQMLGLLVCGGVPACFIYYYTIYCVAKSDKMIHNIVKMFFYGIMILGITSDTFTYSPFGFFMIWLLEYSGKSGLCEEVN